METCQVGAFETQLGWMALAADERHVRQIVFGYPSGAAALAAIAANFDAVAGLDDWQWLVDRLTRYAGGQREKFDDVKLALDHLTDFQRQVVTHCRRIPYGRTKSYGELAALAGHPRAARAVGSTMAANRFPVVVPCHRVINSDGSCGQFGAPGGQATKRRMLALEQPAGVVAAAVQRSKRRPIPAGR